MLCMTTFSEHETAFINATAFHIERDWKGQKGIFADKAGISGGYLSEIIGRKKCPQLDKQEKISKALGYKSVYEFVEFGKTLTVMPKFAIKADTSPTPISLQDEADKKHQIVIEGFKDKELAIKFNQVLVEIEELDADDFKELYENAINKLNKLREKKGISAIQMQKNGTNQL